MESAIERPALPPDHPMSNFSSLVIDGRSALSAIGTELGRQLRSVARAGDAGAVRALLARGAPLTADWAGVGPLHAAAAAGRIAVVIALLRAGASRDARTKTGRTPLHVAAAAGHNNVVRALLATGANVQARDMLGMTPLHWAAERGHGAAVSILLSAGADQTVVSVFRNTARDLASRKHPDLLCLFDNAKLNVTPQPSEQLTKTSVPKESTTEEMLTTASPEETRMNNLEEFPEHSDDDEQAGVVNRGAGAGQVWRALRRGRTLLLTDAGKLMLQDTAPLHSPTKVTAEAKPRVKYVNASGIKLVVNKNACRKLVKVAPATGRATLFTSSNCNKVKNEELNRVCKGECSEAASLRAELVSVRTALAKTTAELALVRSRLASFEQRTTD